MSFRILRLPEVKERVALSRSSIYALAKAGHFPKQFAIAGRAVGWLEEDLEKWLEARRKAAFSKQVIT